MYKIYTKEWRIYHRHLRRIAFAMRITIILLLVAFMHVSAATNAQQITLSERNAPLKSVLNELRLQSGYDFVFTDKLLQRAIPVTIQVKDAAFQAVLQQLFASQPLDFTVDGKVVVLKERTVRGATPASPNTILAYPEVRGTVTDSLGKPLSGASIQVMTAGGGIMAIQTQTNRNGEFTLRNVPQDAFLRISYVGFITHITKIQPQMGTIVLKVQPSLNEVMVNAGYYRVSNRERTGSIARVTAKEIEDQPLVSPLLSLQGRMAGVEVTPNSDLPGAAPTIRIRGQNSLRDEGNYPLYIIDGMPVNSTPLESNGAASLRSVGIDPLSTLNLSNIESIEVLKDADATAIYGSRGANGVVLITTKQGNAQPAGFQARIYTGASTVPNRLDLVNTQQHLQVRRKAFENDGTEPTTTNAPDLLVWDQNRYTDWQDVFFGGTAKVTDVNLSTSGGNASTRYHLSGGYHSQGTVYPGDSRYQKVTSGVSLTHLSKDKKFSLTLALNYGKDFNELMGMQSVILTNLSPNSPPVFNEEGSLHWDEWNATGRTNPFQGYFNSSETNVDNFNSNLGFTYQLGKGLSFKSNLGYTNLQSEQVTQLPLKSYNPNAWEFLDHQSAHLQNRRSSWIVEPQLVYNTAWTGLKLDALVGTTFQQNRNNQMGVTGTGYVSEDLIGNLAAAETLTQGINQTTDYRYNAIFGRLGLNWEGKYFVNLTGRRDGSSRFGAGKRWANFGAVGAAWIFSDERWVREQLGFLSFGKLRGSYGITGNDQIGDYGYLDAYEATAGPGGLYPTSLANPDFSWEVNRKLEAALELGWLRNRLHLGVSWYRNRSSNQLVGYPLPATTGFTTVNANLPATVQNTGWELELSSLNLQRTHFKWQTSVNISFPKNKLVSYPDLEQSSYANRYRVGHPLNIALLYRYEGLDPETGFYRVTDINNDGRYDYDDRVLIKDQNRQFYGGINNTLTYKNLSLQFLWQFGKQEGKLLLFRAGSIGSQRAAITQALEEGSPYQTISTSIEASRAFINVQNTSLPYMDASFLRLKTLSLSYALPATPLRAIGVSACKLFVNGQNLLTLTGYEGMDPDRPFSGTDFGNLRTITAGLQLNL